jgi:hypothetical protein
MLAAIAVAPPAIKRRRPVLITESEEFDPVFSDMLASL